MAVCLQEAAQLPVHQIRGRHITNILVTFYGYKQMFSFMWSWRPFERGGVIDPVATSRTEMCVKVGKIMRIFRGYILVKFSFLIWFWGNGKRHSPIHTLMPNTGKTYSESPKDTLTQGGNQTSNSNQRSTALPSWPSAIMFFCFPNKTKEILQ